MIVALYNCAPTTIQKIQEIYNFAILDYLTKYQQIVNKASISGSYLT